MSDTYIDQDEVITIQQLIDFLMPLRDKNREVWIGNGFCLSNEAVSVYMLNCDADGGCDVIISPRDK